MRLVILTLIFLSAGSPASAASFFQRCLKLLGAHAGTQAGEAESSASSRALPPSKFGEEHPETVAAFTEGTPVERAFLLTHHNGAFSDALVALLASPELASTPRLALISNQFPLSPSGPIWDRMSKIVESDGSLPGVKLNTGELHLAGGYCNWCMSISTRAAVEKIFSNEERRSLKLVLHASASYVLVESPNARTQVSNQTLASQKQRPDYEDTLRKIVAGFVPTTGGWNRVRGNHFVNAKGQQLTVEIVDP